jgi:hypothetical protein
MSRFAAGVDYSDAFGHLRSVLVRRTSVNANADVGLDRSLRDDTGGIGEQMILVVVRANDQSMVSHGNYSSFDDVVVSLRLG